MKLERITELRENCESILETARGYLEDAEKLDAKGDESGATEKREQHDRAMADYDKLEGEYQRAKRLYNALDTQKTELEKAAEAEKRAKRPGDPDSKTPAVAALEAAEDGGEVTTADIRKALNAHIRFASKMGGPLDKRNARIFNEKFAPNADAEERAQSVGTNSEGGFTVDTELVPEIVIAMELHGPMLSGITRILRTPKGNKLQIPTIDDTAEIGTKVAEGADVGTTGDDVVFAQTELDSYAYESGVVLVSVELLRDSEFDIAGLIFQLMGERLGKIGNQELTVGDGTGDPNGIVTASTLGKTFAANNAITALELLDLQHSVDWAYHSDPTCRWQFNQATFNSIRQLSDSDGRLLWQSASIAADFREAAPATILGKPYSVNAAMAGIATTAKSVIFGAHSKYWVRVVGSIENFVFNERYMQNRQKGYLGFMSLDGDLMDTRAVKHGAHPV